MNFVSKIFLILLLVIVKKNEANEFKTPLNNKISHTDSFNNANKKDEQAISIGPCVNNLCPKGFECIENTCFKSLEIPKTDHTLSIGPCVNAKCPEGFSCYENDRQCYAN
uniref:Uncharacterized protein n=1 Tax=Meloidogyne enterolobii TaxID=390850 RepID=A0A6V7WNE1_MELEN|nr:unnamed protein product [Meloidogyne enterolobii]